MANGKPKNGGGAGAIIGQVLTGLGVVTASAAIPGFAEGFLASKLRNEEAQRQRQQQLLTTLTQNPELATLPGVQQAAQEFLGPELTEFFAQAGSVVGRQREEAAIDQALAPFIRQQAGPGDFVPVPGVEGAGITPMGGVVRSGETGVRPLPKAGVRGETATTLRVGPKGKVTTTVGPVTGAQQTARGQALFRKTQVALRQAFQAGGMGRLEADVRAAAIAGDLPGAVPTERGEELIAQAPLFDIPRAQIQAAPQAAPTAPAAAAARPAPAAAPGAVQAGQLGPQAEGFGPMFPLQPGEEGAPAPAKAKAEAGLPPIPRPTPRPGETLEAFQPRAAQEVEAAVRRRIELSQPSKGTFADPETFEIIPASTPLGAIEARDGRRVNAQQISALQAARTMDSIAEDLRNVAATLFTFDDPAQAFRRGLRFRAAGKTRGGVPITGDPERDKELLKAITELQSLSSDAGKLARSRSGEVGVLTERDIARVFEGIPGLRKGSFEKFFETKTTAEQLLNTLDKRRLDAKRAILGLPPAEAAARPPGAPEGFVLKQLPDGRRVWVPAGAVR
jgi:hypothetical protein